MPSLNECCLYVIAPALRHGMFFHCWLSSVQSAYEDTVPKIFARWLKFLSHSLICESFACVKRAQTRQHTHPHTHVEADLPNLPSWSNGINNIINSPIAEASKSKSTTTTTTRSSATATTTNQSRGTTAKPVTPSSTTAPEKKAAGLRTNRPASSASTTIKTTTHSGSSTFSETRNARSKIGSTDNVKNQPGATKVGPKFIIHSLQTGMSLQPTKIANLMMLLKTVV